MAGYNEKMCDERHQRIDTAMVEIHGDIKQMLKGQTELSLLMRQQMQSKRIGWDRIFLVLCALAGGPLGAAIGYWLQKG